MKNIVKISLVTIIGSSILFAGSDMMKKYDVKSGKIEYSIKESGNIMGMVKIKGIGKKRVIFDNYGVKDLTEESKVKKETTGGQTKVDKTHTIQYMNDGIVYSVDFKKKTIVRMDNPAMAMGALFGGGKNMKQTGEAMLKSMGGKKTGTDKVLGYTCDVWDVMGVKQCIYKGVPLRIESNLMGLKSTEIATKATFDLSLNEDDFKLPEYPLVDMMGNKLNLDRSTLNALDKKESAKASQEAQEGAKAMTAAMGALKESGFDMNNPNAQMTEDQKMAMQKAMMAAMGGEDTMLAKTKKEILSDAQDLPEIKKCFQSANSVKEANVCEKKADSEDPEQHTTWNDTIKSNLLKEIDGFEAALPCIEKAASFDALKQCMPQE
jgi:hypothetical protein